MSDQEMDDVGLAGTTNEEEAATADDAIGNAAASGAGSSADAVGNNGDEIEVVNEVRHDASASGSSSKRYESPLWAHFDKDPVDLKIAICLHCGDEVSILTLFESLSRRGQNSHGSYANFTSSELRLIICWARKNMCISPRPSYD